ncbi:hypothetical protein SCB29_00225 [Paraburkholderia sp. SIMBA_055]
MLQAASDVDNLLENTTSITRSAAFHTNRGEQGDSQMAFPLDLAFKRLNAACARPGELFFRAI